MSKSIKKHGIEIKVIFRADYKSYDSYQDAVDRYLLRDYQFQYDVLSSDWDKSYIVLSKELCHLQQQK